MKPHAAFCGATSVVIPDSIALINIEGAVVHPNRNRNRKARFGISETSDRILRQVNVAQCFVEALTGFSEERMAHNGFLLAWLA